MVANIIAAQLLMIFALTSVGAQQTEFLSLRIVQKNAHKEGNYKIKRKKTGSIVYPFFILKGKWI